MITTLSDFRLKRENRESSQGHAADQRLRSFLSIRLSRGCRRRYGIRSPLSEYMSLHLFLKLTTNCEPLSRIKWEICLYKEVFCSFIEFRKSCLMGHTASSLFSWCFAANVSASQTSTFIQFSSFYLSSRWTREWIHR